MGSLQGADDGLARASQTPRWRESGDIEARFDAHAPAVLAFVRLFVTDVARCEQIAAVALIESLSSQPGKRDGQTRACALLAALTRLDVVASRDGRALSQATAALGLVLYGQRSTSQVASDLGCDYDVALELLRQALRERAAA